MNHTRTALRARRGATLIEAMIAMAVLLIGMAGFASLQVISVRANHFAKRISAASALAVEITEHAQRWAYTGDPRLTPYATINGCTQTDYQPCLNDATLTARWNLGTTQTLAYTPQFDDSTLSPVGFPWTGTPIVTGGSPAVTGADVDRDTVPEFQRYYNVYQFGNFGRLVQVIVRWKEPGFGYRQVTNMAFRLDPARLR